MRRVRLGLSVCCLLVGLWLVVFHGMAYETAGHRGAVLVYSAESRAGLAAGVVLLAAGGVVYPRRRPVT